MPCAGFFGTRDAKPDELDRLKPDEPMPRDAKPDDATNRFLDTISPRAFDSDGRAYRVFTPVFGIRLASISVAEEEAASFASQYFSSEGPWIAVHHPTYTETQPVDDDETSCEIQGVDTQPYEPDLA